MSQSWYNQTSMGDTIDTTGRHLEAKMAELGISRRRLARESHVSYRTVCRILAGDRLGMLDTWMRFADAVGCSVSDLIGDSGNGGADDGP